MPEPRPIRGRRLVRPRQVRRIIRPGTPSSNPGTVPTYSGSHGESFVRDASVEFNDTAEHMASPIVYGWARYAPKLVHAELASNNTALWLVYILGEGAGGGASTTTGEFQELNKVYLDGEDVTSGNSMVTIYSRLGTLAQTEITEIPDSNWSSAHPGHPLLALRINLLSGEFSGGQPSVEVVVKGRKLYDWRGGTTTAWSENPILAAYDMLRNTEWGMGVAAADIDTTSFTTAADICDDTMPDAEARYRCSLVLSDRTPAEEVIDDLLKTTCMGRFGFWDGKYRIVLDHAHAIGQTNSDSELTANLWYAQAFVAPGSGRVKAEVRLNNTSAAPISGVAVSIRATRDGADLVAADVTAAVGTARVVADLSSYELTPGDTYYLVIEPVANVEVCANTTTDRYSGGDYWSGTNADPVVWTEHAGDDLWFLLHYYHADLDDSHALATGAVPMLTAPSASRDRSEVPNCVIASYLDTSDWKRKEVRYESAALQGGTEQPRELRINSLAVPSAGQAYRLAKQWLSQSERTLRLAVSVPQHGIQWCEGDVLRINSDTGPLADRWMRVNSIADEEGSFGLELIDYDPSDTADDSYTAETVTLPNLNDVTASFIAYADDFISGDTVSGSVGECGWTIQSGNVAYTTAADHPGIVVVGGNSEIRLDGDSQKYAEKSKWTAEWFFRPQTVAAGSYVFVDSVVEVRVQNDGGTLKIYIDGSDSGETCVSTNWLHVLAWCDGSTTMWYSVEVNGTEVIASSKSVSSTTATEYLSAVNNSSSNALYIDRANLTLGASR